MFGLGAQEIILLTLFGGAIVAAILVALFLVRRGKGESPN